MPTRNVNLTDHLDKFVEKRVKTGQFSKASGAAKEGFGTLDLAGEKAAARRKPSK
ncbi:MAG: hypothetical protein ABIR70_18125 [Bryobacteraceae bacterium]